MAKKRFLIVEDNLSFAINLEMQLEEWGFEVISIANSGEQAYELIKEQTPDFILMDININGELNGLELANKVKDLNCKIIFITGRNDEQTYEAALKAKGTGYLVKPFDMLSLKSFIDLATPKEQENISINNSKNKLYNRQGKQLIQLHIPGIQWIKSDGNYCDVYVNGQRNTIRKSLKKVMESLPEDQFIQTHRSHVINLQFIESISLSDKLIKIGGTELPIGRKYRGELLRRIKKV